MDRNAGDTEIRKERHGGHVVFVWKHSFPGENFLSTLWVRGGTVNHNVPQNHNIKSMLMLPFLKYMIDSWVNM